MLTGIISILSIPALSQEKSPDVPKWVPKGGYWMVETNIKTPLQHSIRFYNNDDVQVGRKDLSGVRLNLKKRKVKMMLKASLEESLKAWETAAADAKRKS